MRNILNTGPTPTHTLTLPSFADLTPLQQEVKRHKRMGWAAGEMGWRAGDGGGGLGRGVRSGEGGEHICHQNPSLSVANGEVRG